MCHKTCDNWVKRVPIFLHMHQSFFFFFFLQFKKFLLENNAGFNLSIVHVFFFFCEVKLFAKKVKIKSTQRDMKSNNATIKITSQITIFFSKATKVSPWTPWLYSISNYMYMQKKLFLLNRLIEIPIYIQNGWASCLIW